MSRVATKVEKEIFHWISDTAKLLNEYEFYNFMYILIIADLDNNELDNDPVYEYLLKNK